MNGEEYCDPDCQAAKAIETAILAEKLEQQKSEADQGLYPGEYTYYEEIKKVEYGDLDALYYKYYQPEEEVVEADGPQSVEEQMQTAAEAQALKEEKLGKIGKIKERIRLKAKGFTQDEKLGFVFPGVDPEVYRKKQEKAQQDGSEESPPAPKMKVGAISSIGVIKIEFDQNMMAPKEIDPQLYS